MAQSESVADLESVSKIPILKSQRTPRDFRQPVIKADRALMRDPGYVAAFVNVPLAIEEVSIVLDSDEAAMLEALRLPVYGPDDGSALRDILFTWWEQRFLGTTEAGAPSISDPVALDD